MTNDIFDNNNKKIHDGDRVRYATWGMFDVFTRDKENSGVKNTDPLYVTNVNYGTVTELVDTKLGNIHVNKDSGGIILICTKSSWCARPEFVEIISSN